MKKLFVFCLSLCIFMNLLSGCARLSDDPQSFSLERRDAAKGIKTFTYDGRTIEGLSYRYSEYYDEDSFVDYYYTGLYSHTIGINSKTKELLFYYNPGLYSAIADIFGRKERFSFMGTIPDFPSCVTDEEKIEAVKRFFQDKVDFSVYNSFDFTVHKPYGQEVPDDWCESVELTWQVVRDGIPCNTVFSLQISYEGYIIRYQNYDATPLLFTEASFVDQKKLDDYITSVILSDKSCERFDHYDVNDVLLCYDHFKPAVRYTVISRDNMDFGIQHMTIVAIKDGWYTRYISRDIWYLM